jgi:hypothetical protein
MIVMIASITMLDYQLIYAILVARSAGSLL